MYEIEELKEAPQFKTVRAGLFDVVSTTFSRTLKKFGRVHVYELTRATGRIVKKLLTGMKMIDRFVIIPKAQGYSHNTCEETTMQQKKQKSLFKRNSLQFCFFRDVDYLVKRYRMHLTAFHPAMYCESPVLAF